jgi:hypothetical protein
LILAFGTALHLSQPLPSGQPPGSKFFVRAMGLMPDHTALWKDSLFAIEVLAMVGLYLYSIDQRESAHVYVSLLMRLLIAGLTDATAWSGYSNCPVGRSTYAVT